MRADDCEAAHPPTAFRRSLAATFALSAFALLCGVRRRRREARHRARRVPAAALRAAGAMRHAGGSRGPQQARRPQGEALRRGAAGQHAVAQARSAVHPRRRPRAGGVAARAVRGAAERDPPHARHRARRPARHRQLVAARVRGVRGEQASIPSTPTRCRAARSVRGRAARPAASTPRNTRRPRGSPTSKPCARRSATRGSTCGAAATASRVALEYLRRHPERVRSRRPRRRRAAGDERHARRLAHARRRAHRHRRGMPQVATCAAAHPDPAATLAAIEADARARGPDDRAVRSAHRRADRASRLTFDLVIGALQPLTYVPELASLIPELLDRAQARRLRPADRDRRRGHRAISPSR